MADNDLYRGDRSNVVYIEQGGQKRWVLDPETLDQTLGGGARVQVRAQADVDTIPAGDTWPSVISGTSLRDGYLISSTASPEIDVMAQARRCWVPDPATFTANGFDWRNVGQISANQWNSIPAGPPLQVRHPIHVETPDVDVGSGLGGGHFMQTVADIPQDSNTLFCTTRTWCTNWVVGFTGGVVVAFLNAEQNIIGSTDVQTFGVDALGIWWKPSHRSDFWTWGVPAGTAAIIVFHKWAPRDRWDEIIAEISEWFRRAAEAYQKYQEFCRQYPSLCDYSYYSGD